MKSKRLKVKRTGLVLRPDNARVLIRPFHVASGERIARIIARVAALSPAAVGELLEQVLAEFAGRHREIRGLFQERFNQMRGQLPTDQPLAEERQLLIGSYFMSEYALESAALFNPAMAPHPDQSGLPAGALRFVLSLRATGEGHLSSICFRTGIVDAAGEIKVNTPTRYVTEPRAIPNALYERELFGRKLAELGLANEFSRGVLERLEPRFTIGDLRRRLDQALRQPGARAGGHETTARGIWLLAQSNYEVQFEPRQRLSERVLFPGSPAQSNGIEDARLVAFQQADGTRIYYATYTAFDGQIILPQMLETKDFLRFKFNTLNGPAVRNKGLALFPRQIDGRYAMLSRQDNENIFLMYSEDVHFWYEPEVLLKPTFPWEFVQLGNCGSPIETDAGWLVLSHGVGPMRKYCIGAFLLDRDNPAKVLGRLREPLLEPNHNEREGYVPNVVYSCGGLIHRGQLILPYAMADYASSFATVSVAELLAAME